MRWLIFGIAVLSASAVHAQTAPVEIPFAPPLHVVLDISETRTRASSDAHGPNGVGRVTAILEINGGVSPYAATWTTTRVEANGQVIDSNSPGAAQLLVGMPIGLLLSENGSPNSVQNWSEFQQRLFAAVIESTPEAQRTEAWRSANEAVQRQFAAMSASDAARLLFQDVGIMALCQHTGLALNEPLHMETMTPNPLGGSPIRTLVTYELTGVDQNAGVAHVVFVSTFDPESVASSVSAMIERARQEAGGSLTAAELEMIQRNAAVTQNARAECAVDLRTGIARSVVYDVSVEGGSELRRTDRRELVVTAR